jgi:esterase
MRLNFHAQGRGFPLLLLHGFLGSLDNWRSASQRLADHYQVFSLDLRNHGSSPHSATMNYDVMAEDVYEFAEDHHLTSIFLLGHSMGGKVAMQFATRFWHKTKKLIVVDIAPRAYEPAHRRLLHTMLSLDLARFKSFGAVDKALEEAVANAGMRQFLLKNVTRDRNKQLQWKCDIDAIARNYDHLSEAITPRRSFTQPACFIRGDRSNYIQEADLPTIRKIFPNAELKTIVGAGHWVRIDAPESFVRTLTEFLKPD